MNVAEEPSDRLGRWFARFDRGDVETFSARLLEGTDELQIAWTANIRQLASNIREIQDTIGRSVPRLSGTASVGVEAMIKAGRFNSGLYARHLALHLGGEWRVAVNARTDVRNEVWEIVATRLGD